MAIFCKDCKHFSHLKKEMDHCLWYDYYCSHTETLNISVDCVTGKTEKTQSHCREINSDFNCKYFEKCK